LFDAAGSNNVAALVEKARKNNVQLVFPVDYITADKFDKNALVRLALAHLQTSADKATQTRLVLQQIRMAFQRVGWVLMLDQRAKNYSAQPSFLRRPFYGMGSWLFALLLMPFLMCHHSPAGVFEFPAFAAGSKALLDANIEAAQNGAVVIVGGGDTATLAAQYNAEDRLSHVSTGGGASLELLEGKASHSGMSWNGSR